MLIKIKVIPNSQKNEIVEQSPTFMKIKIAAPPEKGKANQALIKFLAEHFKIPKTSIAIKNGLTSKTKLIQLSKTH